MASITLKETTVARLWVEYSTTTDTTNNRSTTSLTLKLTTLNNYNIGPWGDFNGSYFGTTSNKFDGAIPNFQGTRNLATYTATVNHNSDGKGTLTIYWKWGVNSPWGGYTNPSGSFNITLPTIPRATTPVLSASEVNLGGTLTITLNRALASHTHDIAIYYGSKSLMIAQNVATSYTWTVPTSIGQWIPNATSMDCQITVRTYQNGNLNGSKSVNVKIKIPDSAKPTISSVKLSETNTSIGNFGLWIQGMSKIKVDTSASGIYGSTISSIYSNIEGVVYGGSSFTTNTITKAGSLQIKVDVQDSRGRTATHTQTITINEYAPPQILTFDVRRCDSAGNIKENGTYARIAYSYKITPLNNKNAKSIKISYKKTSEASYTTLFTSSELYEGSDVYFTGNLFDLSTSYDMLFEVSDSFTSSPIPSHFTLTSERVPFELLYTGLGVSIGKAAELDETFEVDLATIFNKNVSFGTKLNADNGLTYKLMSITEGDDLNNYTTDSGVYYVSGSVANRPVTGGGWLIVYANGASSIYQKYIALAGGVYERIKGSNGWSVWSGHFTSEAWEYDIYMDGRVDMKYNATTPFTFTTSVRGMYESSERSLLLPINISSVSYRAIQGYLANGGACWGRVTNLTSVGNFKSLGFRMATLQNIASNTNATYSVHLVGKL